MKHYWWLSLIALLVVQGCERVTETPPDVAQAYRTLLGSLDPSSPGASFARLEEFVSQNARYTIATIAEADLQAWRTRLDEAYMRGRDLVREEQFEQAEAVLNDLAQVPDEQAGRLAREFLAFEFAQMKATRLLQQGDTAAAEGVLRELMTRDLSAEQMTAAQRLLDSTSVVSLGMAMAQTTSLRSSARTLQISLFESYVETGHYPAALTLDSPELSSLVTGGQLADVVASIDDYRVTGDTFSLILTGKGSGQRLRITESTIEEVR